MIVPTAGARRIARDGGAGDPGISAGCSGTNPAGASVASRLARSAVPGPGRARARSSNAPARRSRRLLEGRATMLGTWGLGGPRRAATTTRGGSWVDGGGDGARFGGAAWVLRLLTAAAHQPCGPATITRGALLGIGAAGRPSGPGRSLRSRADLRGRRGDAGPSERAAGRSAPAAALVRSLLRSWGRSLPGARSLARSLPAIGAARIVGAVVCGRPFRGARSFRALLRSPLPGPARGARGAGSWTRLELLDARAICSTGFWPLF